MSLVLRPLCQFCLRKAEALLAEIYVSVDDPGFLIYDIIGGTIKPRGANVYLRKLATVAKVW